jgi:lactate dehydrogenase-like 2-hydroxyacid dehydrogenase
MKILVIDPLFDTVPDVEEAAAGPGVELIFRRSVQGTLPDHRDYADVDAVLNCRSAHKLSAEIIAKLDRCRCIAQGGVGYGHVDLRAAGERGIPVINTPDYGTTEVADHAVALSLALLRGIQAYDRRLRRSNDSWDARLLKTVKRLGDMRVGIIGMGRIGTAAALRFQSFGMEVGYYDPHLPVGHHLSYGWKRFDSLEALLARSDLLSVHCLLNEDTANMIDAEAIAAMPEGAVLVNTARGGIVDFNALHDALKRGHLNAAGLDVFQEEPLDRENALIKAWAAGEEWLDEKLILTPHSAFYSTASILDIRRLSMTYLMDYMRTGRLRTCVNSRYLADRAQNVLQADAGAV